MDEPNVKAIQDYSYDVLPQRSGDTIVVKNIGAIALNKDEFEVEGLIVSNLYKITKK